MSFDKILIANRGEIACRVIASARALGYRTVAVYSEADRDARHVRLADEALCIGPANATASYLNIDALLDACRRSGADAVHPGYGFLSENGDFAQACEDAGITFIGPPVAAIRLMGSKRLSKIAMEEAGVPCVPGYQGEDQSDDTLLREARRIGLPLMIKASAGGGGRGMRVVTDEAEIPAQLNSARQEARNSFGNDELILERAVSTPRHVEIQVFGDHHGNVVHLGERDCSVQRRHQKVVEEAPSPALDQTLRQRMGEAAVNAARACGYVGAGTVEFLLGADGDFYFLEMNTRLQVEHPVTELVTGQDLVAWQLKVAAGEALPLTQDQVALNGHAMEVRLYAEDPAQGYLPQTGPIRRWRPASGEGVRVDHGLREGDQVGSHYDPMLAKIIAHGATRDEARRRLLRAVEDTVLSGVNDNRAFLAAILRHPVFAAGDATTAFIGADFADAPSLTPAQPGDALWSVAALLFARQQDRRRSGPGRGWQSSALGAQPLTLGCGEHSRTLTLQGPRVGGDVPVVLEDVDDDSVIAEVDGIRRRFQWCRHGDQLWLQHGTDKALFQDLTHQPAAGRDGPGSGRLSAPMDGAVVSLSASVGEQVRRGQVLAVMEAMKMEHVLKADCDGTVTEVAVAVGDQVRRQQLLVVLEADVVPT
ncbi:Carbamoyl-phosphate synthase L chain, ATP binding domain protein [Alloalcanivorax dieselolei B5]|uniref:Biotin carboxylase n=1 Tax=Alcanivorax dieselolei (strain DSM 16502 / CGMCC 1.3690 / MCCC 1A00001 / B-5) TaxID=930169 RepID=K0CEH7_ALCDB|nr:acetyl/propionyl/methylcrotonyl-CoA carboxylase subunit alpha [Alloalcanivorax dieselolei]AFT70072.1 Carbamoyl-phosphate synthase L chain, ATP binding domain protein [Alloalcanivorax dieselolei B5]GGJ96695.1 geranyl-CoA carboxylase subunit alpha [Alloalcanivorax dieselolei]